MNKIEKNRKFWPWYLMLTSFLCDYIIVNYIDVNSWLRKQCNVSWSKFNYSANFFRVCYIRIQMGNLDTFDIKLTHAWKKYFNY